MPFGIHPTAPPRYRYRVVYRDEAVFGSFTTEQTAHTYANDPGTITGNRIPDETMHVEKWDSEEGWQEIPRKRLTCRNGRWALRRA